MDCKNVFKNASEGPCQKTYTQLWIKLIMHAAQEQTALNMRKETEWKR